MPEGWGGESEGGEEGRGMSCGSRCAAWVEICHVDREVFILNAISAAVGAMEAFLWLAGRWATPGRNKPLADANNTNDRTDGNGGFGHTYSGFASL